MSVKLFESELKVMDLLWKEGDLSAKEIAQRLKEQINWSKTTTYTVLKKMCGKAGYIAYRTRVYVHALDKQGRSTKSRN